MPRLAATLLANQAADQIDWCGRGFVLLSYRVTEVEDLLVVAAKEGILETVPDEKCLQVFPL
jgi:hypothetical protein